MEKPEVNWMKIEKDATTQLSKADFEVLVPMWKTRREHGKTRRRTNV